MNRLSALILVVLFRTTTDAAQWSLSNVIQTPGNKADASKVDKILPGLNSANFNRFGFYSDLSFDKFSKTWLALFDGALSAGVVQAQKFVEFDLLAALKAQGIAVPEKMEGLAIDPRLFDGRYQVLVGTDNDYSVTQSGSGEQFDVCVNPLTNARTQVAFNAACPAGAALILGYLMSFAVDFRL